jgi:hypothetical protein
MNGYRVTVRVEQILPGRTAAVRTGTPPEDKVVPEVTVVTRADSPEVALGKAMNLLRAEQADRQEREEAKKKDTGELPDDKFEEEED